MQYDDLVETMYPCGITSLQMAEKSILTGRNDDVRITNMKILNKLPGDIVTCIGIDEATACGTDRADESDETTSLAYPPEYLASITPPGLPPQKLNLKVGAIVMLIRNLIITDGLCNGTRLIIRKIGIKILHCEILTGDHKGEIVSIPRITLNSADDGSCPFILHRTQFLVRFVFAMTINKNQGQSFEQVGLYLTPAHPIFGHGQLYVALSRCRSRNGILIQVERKCNR